MSLLEIAGVESYYGESHILRDLSMRVEEGEICALLGRNGAGKSTTLRSIAGATPPEVRDGTVTYKSRDITGMPAEDISMLGISCVPEERRVFGNLTVEENANIASFGAEHGSFRFNFFRHRNAYPEVEQRTREVLDAVELLDQRETTASALPYGDKRRLELGIALASEPSLLLMDEPTAGMSPEETAATVDLVEDLQADLDLTIMLVEHDMEVVFRVSDRIAVLNRGSVIAEGTPEAVQGDPAVQEAYLGGVEL